ncbi:MAG: 50S ribosomal protein L34e [Candidatus Aenigmatarchaeota archaeon]|nr:MAG: 50S ribosomal protein L34e [Candidatus Aenigmarchaeota archaeon]
MPTRAQRSRSFRRKRVTTPGGTVRVRYRKKQPGIARCAECKRPLHGVPRGLPSEIRKLRKSQRSPERPYGGNLCAPCTRAKVKLKNMERWKE